jgi:Pyruvate/2-oxoacid:ferredoxin oxidoreductase delta subunit
MCEFCHKHGEGEKWYLQAKNYSQDLESDLKKRRVFDMEVFGQDLRRLGELKKAPFFIKAFQEHRLEERVKNMHFGQVLPIEDVERIFGFVNSVTRIACVCRQTRLGSEQRYCYGVSMLPPGERLREYNREITTGFGIGPDTSGLEAMSKEQALENFRQYEKEGLCHSVWTHLTPFVVGICNCDRSDCGAMQSTLVNGVRIMFRAEYVAEADAGLCNGCRACMRVCQFGAIAYSAATKKIFIDMGRCYGCGICRASCNQDAIKLVDRVSVPAAANLW